MSQVQNDIDRFHLVQDTLNRLPHVGAKADHLKQLIQHKHYITTHGEDLPEVLNWKWG